MVKKLFISPVDSDRHGFFIITQNEFDNWNLELGARIETVDYDPEIASDEDFSVYSISAGIIRNFANGMSASLNISRSERPPEETALFADGPHLATLTFERGDSNIDEEVFNTIEVGLGQTQKNVRWQNQCFLQPCR